MTTRICVPYAHFPPPDAILSCGRAKADLRETQAAAVQWFGMVVGQNPSQCETPVSLYFIYRSTSPNVGEGGLLEPDRVSVVDTSLLLRRLGANQLIAAGRAFGFVPGAADLKAHRQRGADANPGLISPDQTRTPVVVGLQGGEGHWG